MNIEAFFNDKRYWIVRHFLFWTIMYLDELFGLIGITEPYPFGDFIFVFLLDVWLVYFNLYYLIPKFFEKGRILSYIILTILTLVGNVFFSLLYSSIDCNECLFCEDCIEFYGIFTTSLLTLSVLGVALTIKISKLTFKKQRKLLSLQKLQMTTELNYLKKQINPHFLFNVLNNIYVQSKESPKDVPESIMQLSELMRYQTYDASKDTVPLTREIDFCKQYLDLESMRKENLNIKIEEHGHLKNIDLPPLLFLPFIENACKHSTRIYNEHEQILVTWSRIESTLVFTIENSMGHKYQIIEGEKYSGFGLDNIQKRLNLLYPDSHTLSITETDQLFRVKLEIELPSDNRKDNLYNR